MQKKVAGHETHFNLDDNGKVSCREFGISADTFQECEKLVSDHIKEIDAVAKSNAGTKVMLSVHRGGYKTAKLGKIDGDSNWVVYDEGNNRCKENKKKVYVFDQSIIDEMQSKRAEIDALELEYDSIENKAIQFFGA